LSESSIGIGRGIGWINTDFIAVGLCGIDGFADKWTSTVWVIVIESLVKGLTWFIETGEVR
jgi:hypothetical protein